MPSLGGMELSPETAQIRFAETCAVTGLNDGVASDLWEQVSRAYQATERHCHNLSHILSILKFIDRALAAKVPVNDRAAVEWAAWLHDLCYHPAVDAGGDCGEAVSAEAAAALLGRAGLPSEMVDKVVRYVLLTRGAHHIPGDPDSELLVDAYLSVLGCHLPQYVAYAEALRREHSHLDDVAYAAQRATTLKALLDREALFTTQAGKALCEAQARANMREEWQRVYAGQLMGSCMLVDETDENEVDS